MERFLIEPKSWPVAGSFRISRSALTQIETVQVKLRLGEHEGRAECRPYARYGDSVESVSAQLEALRKDLIGADIDTAFAICAALPFGPTRNALDCALWDLRAKTQNKPAWKLLGIAQPKKRQTAFTLSLDTPGNMAKAARKAAAYPLLKIKIGQDEAIGCVKAVCAARPDAQLIVDANEALPAQALPEFHAALLGLNIALIEQPLAAGKDGPDSLPKDGLIYCADESLHSAADLPRLKAAGYRAVNVKLDKCGGVSEALTLMKTAKEMGFSVMAGCMVSSSLAMAPMMVLESLADYIDLDGPLLLAKDCGNPIIYEGAQILPPSRDLWG